MLIDKGFLKKIQVKNNCGLAPNFCYLWGAYARQNEQ